MIRTRPSGERGHFDHGWLDTRHTFSFADYYAPLFMGFRALRVINEDRVKPGRGFPDHFHRDMEILTCVLEGALEHKDSMGNGAVIRPGEIQRMSAGTGLRHSEFNPSKDEVVHLLQIWIEPSGKGIDPGYEQRRFPVSERRNRWRLVVSRTGREDSMRICQDVDLYWALLDAGSELELPLKSGRHSWLQMIRGEVSLGPQSLHEGDGAAISEETGLKARAATSAELLWFDLA